MKMLGKVTSAIQC